MSTCLMQHEVHRHQVVTAVHHQGGSYRLDTASLDSCLIPKRASAADPDEIRRQGRGVAYARTAFAYVFTAGKARTNKARQ